MRGQGFHLPHASIVCQATDQLAPSGCHESTEKQIGQGVALADAKLCCAQAIDYSSIKTTGVPGSSA
ncbi:MAG TPA: hypothetical protein VNN55_08490 [bacterium]|nr:hypothetical protein [bacterium]